MSSRISVVRLLNAVSLASGAVQYTKTVDLRVGTPRIEAVVARGFASSSQPEFKVEWAGGITTAELDGEPTGDVDRFQLYDVTDVNVPAENTANDDVINTTDAAGENRTHGLGSEEWLLSPFPDVLWPFIRFRLTVADGSPTADYDLFLVLRKRFDG